MKTDTTNIFLTEEEINFCKIISEMRTNLQEDDPSLSYTTYKERRSDNNFIGQVAEVALLKFFL
ncbi:hypothetical protein ACFFHT_06600 [Gallibacterium melopsittaci]|uniref:Uncharacterized protein n=1 Tax=Gallibacterium melopsittaci TaxID=516063 RepID=A0ABV6HWH3_9PAST